MVHVWDPGMIHALYLSHVGVSEHEEMIEAPIIIEGAKHPRIEEGKVEKLNNLKYITQVTIQWLKRFINTGDTLLKIPHPCAHAPQYSSFSLLSPISLP